MMVFIPFIFYANKEENNNEKILDEVILMIKVNRPRMRMAEIMTPPIDEENLLLFYDAYGNRFFERKEYDILRAAYLANKKLVTYGMLELNNVFNFLHLPRVPTANKIGWVTTEVDWLNIEHEQIFFEGERCFQIIFVPAPHFLQTL